MRKREDINKEGRVKNKDSEGAGRAVAHWPRNYESAFAVQFKNADPQECVKAAGDGSFHMKPGHEGFSADVWFCMPCLPETAGCLAACGDLSLSLTSGEILLTVKEKSYRLLGQSPSPGIWHNLAVSFSNGALIGYYDGITVYSDKEEVEAFDIPAGEWILGKGFCGFIRSLRLFGSYMTRDTLGRVLYAGYPGSLPEGAKAVLWYDLSCKTPVELVQGKKILLCQASPGDLSSQIVFNGDTAFKFSDPCQSGSQEYSLALKLRPLLPHGRREAIFSRVINESGDRLCLLLDSEGDAFHFEAAMGDKAVLKSADIASMDICRWHSVILTGGPEGCSLTVDGICSQTAELKDAGADCGEGAFRFPGIAGFCHPVRIGSGDNGEESGFHGYIRYLAEFAAMLDEKTAAAFETAPPFLFDVGIHSLFLPVCNLEGEALKEELTGIPLESVNGSFAAAGKTQPYFDPEPLSYRNDGTVYSDNPYRMWKTGFFCALFQYYVQYFYGVSPASGYDTQGMLLGQAGEFIYGSYAVLPEFELFLLLSPFNPAQRMDALFGKLADSGLLGRLFRLFYSGPYFMESSLNALSLEFLRKVFLCPSQNKSYRDAFAMFTESARALMEGQWKGKSSFEGEGGFAVWVEEAGFEEEDGIFVCVTLGYRKKPGGLGKAAIRGYADPSCFEGTQEGEAVFDKESGSCCCRMAVVKPRMYQFCELLAFSIMPEGEKQACFLDSFRLEEGNYG